MKTILLFFVITLAFQNNALSQNASAELKILDVYFFDTHTFVYASENGQLKLLVSSNDEKSTSFVLPDSLSFLSCDKAECYLKLTNQEYLRYAYENASLEASSGHKQKFEKLVSVNHRDEKSIVASTSEEKNKLFYLLKNGEIEDSIVLKFNTDTGTREGAAGETTDLSNSTINNKMFVTPYRDFNSGQIIDVDSSGRVMYDMEPVHARRMQYTRESQYDSDDNPKQNNYSSYRSDSSIIIVNGEQNKMGLFDYDGNLIEVHDIKLERPLIWKRGIDYFDFDAINQQFFCVSLNSTGIQIYLADEKFQNWRKIIVAGDRSVFQFVKAQKGALFVVYSMNGVDRLHRIHL